MAYQVVLRKMAWRWDRPRRLLWWSATTSDGQTVEVGIPLEQVSLAFQHELAQADVQEEISACAGSMGAVEILGAIEIIAPESVDGFLSGIKRAAKRATRPVRRAVKRTTKKLGKTALRSLKTARKGLMSKYTGYGLMAISAAMPAVGGPALAAWATAKQIDNHARDAERLVRSLAGRAPNARQRNMIARAQQYAARTRQLSQTNSPMARMMIAGLRSV